jgi:cyclopropane fatty-acyl-phospholipid synthase-like methyltransferase
MRTALKKMAAVSVALLVGTLVWAQDPVPFRQVLLQVLDIRPGTVVAEIGAGTGDLSFAMAEQVGAGGRVYANEVVQDKVDAIERVRKSRGLANVDTILGGEEDPRLPGRVDLVVMVDVYHHMARPDEFLKKLATYMKPGARLAVAAVVNKRNPQAKPRTSKDVDPCVSDPEETRKAIEKTGFVFEKLVLHEDAKRSFFWPTSYILVFRAPETAPEPSSGVI